MSVCHAPGSRETLLGLCLAACLAALPGHLSADRAERPQYAPPEAWLPGESLPYFGSENPWDRRFFYETPPRIGQPQYLLLLEGKADEAAALCEKRLAADAADVESLLVLALARGAQGRMEEADRLLAQALKLGLPPERLVVDRSALMRRVQGTPVWRRTAAAQSGLLHGPLLGDVTPRSARFWVRSRHETVFEVRVSARGDFARPDAVGRGRTHAADDFTGVAHVEGLKPDAVYRYDVRIGDAPAIREDGWEFRTFPEPAAKTPVRIAFGGCAKFFPAHERMWETIRMRRPDALLLLGDNVYLDLPERVGPMHDYTYHQRQSRPEFRRLTAGVPSFAIWDDHDAGIDDVFLGPFPDRPAWKVDHLKLFQRNWNNPPTGAPPAWPGLWHRVRIGPVECFLLDGRYYRENFLQPNPSMLGPVQKAWLLAALRESTAPFKLLVSPVAWADDAKIERAPSGEIVRAKDIWSGFPGERQEIFDFLTQHRIGGVILLSSDRHRNDVRVHPREGAYPLWELESGWLTNEKGTEGSGSPRFQYLDGPAFGSLTFDPAAPDPTVVMEIVTIAGVPVFRQELKLSALSHD